jgi:hypothetical protein
MDKIQKPSDSVLYTTVRTLQILPICLYRHMTTLWRGEEYEGTFR